MIPALCPRLSNWNSSLTLSAGLPQSFLLAGYRHPVSWWYLSGRNHSSLWSLTQGNTLLCPKLAPLGTPGVVFASPGLPQPVHLSHASLAPPGVSAGCLGGLIRWHFATHLLVLSICYLPFFSFTFWLLLAIYWVKWLIPNWKHSFPRSFSIQFKSSCAKERWK